MADQIKSHCAKSPQVQIVVADGLSSAAIESNVPDLLPALSQGLTRQGLSTGTSIFVKYGRVRVMDEVTDLLGAQVTILLVGERPGLVTNESLLHDVPGPLRNGGVPTYGGLEHLPRGHGPGRSRRVHSRHSKEDAGHKVIRHGPETVTMPV